MENEMLNTCGVTDFENNYWADLFESAGQTWLPGDGRTGRKASRELELTFFLLLKIKPEECEQPPLGIYLISQNVVQSGLVLTVGPNGEASSFLPSLLSFSGFLPPSFPSFLPSFPSSFLPSPGIGHPLYIMLLKSGDTTGQKTTQNHDRC